MKLFIGNQRQDFTYLYSSQDHAAYDLYAVTQAKSLWISIISILKVGNWSPEKHSPDLSRDFSAQFLFRS